MKAILVSNGEDNFKMRCWYHLTDYLQKLKANSKPNTKSNFECNFFLSLYDLPLKLLIRVVGMKKIIWKSITSRQCLSKYEGIFTHFNSHLYFVASATTYIHFTNKQWLLTWRKQIFDCSIDKINVAL